MASNQHAGDRGSSTTKFGHSRTPRGKSGLEIRDGYEGELVEKGPPG